MEARQESSIPRLDEPATTRYVNTPGVVTMQDPTILILASLADGDKHGYAIMEDIQVFASIRLGPGTLYGAICRLERRRRIRYASRRHLSLLRRPVRRAWGRAPSAGDYLY